MMFECCTCEYEKLSIHEHPCSSCDSGDVHGTNWEPQNEAIAMEDAPPSNDKNDDVVDMVNRPPHYTHGKYECIDVMVENFGKEAVQKFCLLNAFKYVWRSDYKNGTEDVKKAMWYLDKYLELEGEHNAESN